MIKVVKLSNMLIIIIAFILIIFFIYKNNSLAFINDNHKINSVFYSCLNDTLNYSKPEKEKQFQISSLSEFILFSELNKISLERPTDSPSQSSLEPDIDLYESESSSTEQLDNSIPLTYTNDYNGVLINNSSDYEITDELFDNSTLNINKKNIIIFHTHTCESYTPTENYQYEESRKLQNNRFKLFCS